MGVRTTARVPSGRWLFVVLATLFVTLPTLGWAQTSAGISGVVRDPSGAILPGVTVEASSPALIEKVRTAVTDGQGRFSITDLRPGVYAVTATLPGFSSSKREGLELSAGFTASVPIELKVGSVEETITVSGATPIVDTQNTRTQQVLKADTLNALPGARSLTAFASMTLGAVASTAGRNDVGGDKGEQSTGIVLHGGRGDDGRTNWDGMNANVFFGNAGGQQRVYYFNTVGVQEVVVDTGGNSPEIETGGANINLVPKDGGNQFSMYSTANFTNDSFSAKGISDDLAARGVKPSSSVKRIWDHGVGVGGPIRRDRLWFYTPNRWWGAQNFAPSNYFNKSTNPFVYEPDLNRPAYGNSYYADNGVRLTWQASPKNKFTQEEHFQHGCTCWQGVAAGGRSSPEADQDFQYGPQVLSQTTWAYTATNKLLFQAGASFLRQEVSFSNGSGASPNYFFATGEPSLPSKDRVAITDDAIQYTWNAIPGGTSTYGYHDRSDNFNQRFAVSYITGSHAIKAGLQTLQGRYDTFGMQEGVNQFNYHFFAGLPSTVVQFAGPFQSQVRVASQGLYMQDQWTRSRLTLNMGVRYDHFGGRTLAADLPAGPFIPARRVEAQKNVPSFHDITPRIGLSYDVFGNGRTAIKVAFGRYLYGQGGGAARNVDPATAITTQSSRSWYDAPNANNPSAFFDPGIATGVNPSTGVVGNRNFTPDCDLTNFAANGECGPLNNANFGKPNPLLSYDPSASVGWFNREYNYQTSVQLQQELWPGVGIAVGYFRTTWGNLTAIRNLTSTTPADFNELCVTAANDPALGSVSGQQVCGFYAPKTFAAPLYSITRATDLGLGSPQEQYNGVDIAFSARWGAGALIQGGVTVGREVVDNCYANGHPEVSPANTHGIFIYGGAIYGFPSYPQGTSNGDTYCHVTSSWWNGIGSQAKMQAVYPLPGDFQLSGTWKTLPGIPITATQYSFDPRAATLQYQFLPASLIPIASAGASIGTRFDSRLYQTDLRLTKSVRLNKTRVQGILDLYNVFNNRVSQANQGAVGAPGQFLTPTSLLGGRLLKFGAQVTF